MTPLFLPRLTRHGSGYRADLPVGPVLRSGFGLTEADALDALRLACGLPVVPRSVAARRAGVRA